MQSQSKPLYACFFLSLICAGGVASCFNIENEFKGLVNFVFTWHIYLVANEASMSPAGPVTVIAQQICLVESFYFFLALFSFLQAGITAYLKIAFSLVDADAPSLVVRSCCDPQVGADCMTI